jgi:hypothetical protein
VPKVEPALACGPWARWRGRGSGPSCTRLEEGGDGQDPPVSERTERREESRR